MKRPTKRKLYQKRRKKEKAEERKKGPLPAKPSTKFHRFNNDTVDKKFQRNPARNNSQQQNSAFGPITYTLGLQMWWQTYCAAIEFHTTQQNAWIDDSKEQELSLLKKYADEYETSSEEDNDEYSECNNAKYLNYKDTNDEALGQDVDEEYMKFLEITHKHREELRLKRAEENV